MSDCVEISGILNIKRISDNNKTPSLIGNMKLYFKSILYETNDKGLH